ncbi:MAG: hypothetical protein HOP29_11050 [Phycisphaerales bacterium]|nr:hypothetical protein [Phycisphaerales bacterium]
MSGTWLTRWREKRGDFAVPCVVSCRWLEFSQGGSTHISEGEAITISVMTDGADEQPRKLCELIVTREEIARVLSLIEKPSV